MSIAVKLPGLDLKIQLCRQAAALDSVKSMQIITI